MVKLAHRSNHHQVLNWCQTIWKHLTTFLLNSYHKHLHWGEFWPTKRLNLMSEMDLFALFRTIGGFLRNCFKKANDYTVQIIPGNGCPGTMRVIVQESTTSSFQTKYHKIHNILPQTKKQCLSKNQAQIITLQLGMPASIFHQQPPHLRQGTHNHVCLLRHLIILNGFNAGHIQISIVTCQMGNQLLKSHQTISQGYMPWIAWTRFFGCCFLCFLLFFSK